MEPVSAGIMATIGRSLGGVFNSLVIPKITNAKGVRDLKAAWSKDNYSRKTLEIFTASILDAKALTALPDDLIEELLDDQVNRIEIFRWILEGVQSDQIDIENLVLEPYQERYPTYSERMFVFFLIIAEKLNEYKKIHWDASELEMINRISQIQKSIEVFSERQDKHFDMLNEMNENVKSIKSNNINVRANFAAQIITMLQENNLEAAENYFYSIIRMIKNSHEDQDWSYKISLDGSTPIIVEEPSSNVALEKLEKRFEVKFVVPEKNSGLNSIAEIIQYGRNKQITVELELKELNVYAGDHLIKKKRSEYEGNLIMEIPPIPFPSIDTKLIVGDDNDVSVHLWMQITEILDDNSIVISNKNQPNKDLEYQFTYNLSTNETSKFNIGVPDDKKFNVSTNLTFLKIADLAETGTSAKMVHLSNEKEICFSTQMAYRSENDESGLIRILEKLARIETFFGVIFELPEIFEPEVIKSIFELESLITKEKWSYDIEDFNIQMNDFKLLSDLIERIDSGEPLNYTASQSSDFPLMGYTFNVKSNLTFAPCTIKSIDNIKKKIEVLSDGDSILVTFVPVDEKNKTANFTYASHSYSVH